MALNTFFDPMGPGESSHLGGLAAFAAYKEKAERALAMQAELNATIEEVNAALEDELRDLRYELHSMVHSEPDDSDSRAHRRWLERQRLLEKHIADVEEEIEDTKEAIRSGTYEV
ncbi:MAG: hypothetical protein IJX52_06535 [Oscillibacter sp.]|nr:hypothetical protein [Oscillibacter sp.]